MTTEELEKGIQRYRRQRNRLFLLMVLQVAILGSAQYTLYLAKKDRNEAAAYYTDITHRVAAVQIQADAAKKACGILGDSITEGKTR